MIGLLLSFVRILAFHCGGVYAAGYRFSTCGSCYTFPAGFYSGHRSSSDSRTVRGEKLRSCRPPVAPGRGVYCILAHVTLSVRGSHHCPRRLRTVCCPRLALVCMFARLCVGEAPFWELNSGRRRRHRLTSCSACDVAEHVSELVALTLVTRAICARARLRVRAFRACDDVCCVRRL